MKIPLSLSHTHTHARTKIIKTYHCRESDRMLDWIGVGLGRFAF